MRRQRETPIRRWLLPAAAAALAFGLSGAPAAGAASCEELIAQGERLAVMLLDPRAREDLLALIEIARQLRNEGREERCVNLAEMGIRHFSR